jgi:hypothetical protein
MDYALVLTHHADYAGRLWGMTDNDLSTLTWDDANDIPAPSKADLDARGPQVIYDLEMSRVRAERHAAYAAPDGPDAIFLQWQRGDATEQEWLDSVQAVKDANPYPVAPTE